MNWIKLKSANDWGVDYFAIEPLGAAGTADAKRGIKLEQGDRIEVRMADGAVIVAAVHFRRGQSSYSDHGRDCAFATVTPYVAISFHGQVAKFEFDEIEVDEAWARSKGAK